MHSVIYNTALSTIAGGTASSTSSAPFATGFEANWAIDGVVTFCNDAINCPGTNFNKMFKSLTAITTTDVYFLINMSSVKNIISLYLSLDESSTSQHIGMEVRIGGNTLASSMLCYKVTVATFSRWISCGTGISGQFIWITMPVVGKSLNLIEVMAFEYYFVQQGIFNIWFANSG